MLGKWPFPNKLSETPAWARGLWIRRVLVRAQEGQLEAPHQTVGCGAFAVLQLWPSFLLPTFRRTSGTRAADPTVGPSWQRESAEVPVPRFAFLQNGCRVCYDTLARPRQRMLRRTTSAPRVFCFAIFLKDRSHQRGLGIVVAVEPPAVEDHAEGVGRPGFRLQLFLEHQYDTRLAAAPVAINADGYGRQVRKVEQVEDGLDDVLHIQAIDGGLVIGPHGAPRTGSASGTGTRRAFKFVTARTASPAGLKRARHWCRGGYLTFFRSDAHLALKSCDDQSQTTIHDTAT
jgi:hypothetical protein